MNLITEAFGRLMASRSGLLITLIVVTGFAFYTHFWLGMGLIILADVMVFAMIAMDNRMSFEEKVVESAKRLTKFDEWRNVILNFGFVETMEMKESRLMRNEGYGSDEYTRKQAGIIGRIALWALVPLSLIALFISLVSPLGFFAVLVRVIFVALTAIATYFVLTHGFERVMSLVEEFYNNRRDREQEVREMEREWQETGQGPKEQLREEMNK